MCSCVLNHPSFLFSPTIFDSSFPSRAGEGAQRGGGCCSGPLPAGSGGGVRGSRDGRAGDHIPAVPAHLTEARYQGKGARLLLVLKVIKHPPRLGFCLWSRVSTLQCRFDFHWHLGFCSWWFRILRKFFICWCVCLGLGIGWSSDLVWMQFDLSSS